MSHPQLKLEAPIVQPTTVPLSPVIPALTFNEKVKAKTKSILQQLLGRNRIGKPLQELQKVSVNRNHSSYTGKKWVVTLLNKAGRKVMYLPGADVVVLKDCKFECRTDHGCGGSTHSGVAIGYLVTTSPIDDMPASAKPVVFDRDDGQFIDKDGKRVDGGKYLVLDGKDARIIHPK